MENLDRRLLLAGLGLVGAAAAASAGAGTLNPPPGPVTATGKTTNEIEPRVAVQSLAGDANNSFIISQPGSYYLTGNINATGGKNGISVQADSVTLDLGGFALIGEATGSGIGINVPAARNSLCIHNGIVCNWRSHGVAALNASSSALERLRAVSNLGGGLMIGNESVVRDCVMTGNGEGLVSADRVLVIGCVCDVNAFGGMDLASDVQVVDCVVLRTLGGVYGIQVGARSMMSRCTVNRSLFDGIRVGAGTTVADCNSSFNGGVGIKSSDDCSIVRNTCYANQSDGIWVVGIGSAVEDNLCVNNGTTGVFISSANNLVIRNRARGNATAQFSSAGGAIAFAAVSDVSASANFPSSQPWTNFVY